MVLHIGIKTMDNKVESTTQLVANCASRLYFTANIAVFIPAGMAASNTDTPAINSGTPAHLHPINTNAGITINLSAENMSVVLSTIVLISPSARITPMSNMVIGVEHAPRLERVPLIAVGSCI